MRTLVLSISVLLVLLATARAQTVDDLETAPPPPTPAAPPHAAPPPAPAAHPYAPVAEKRFEREGFTVGVGLGLGSLSIEDSSGAGVGLSLRMGGMVSERLGILGEIESVTHFEDGVSWTSSFLGPAILGFVSDQVWLTGGLGVTWISLSDGYVEAETTSGGALLFGAGVDVHQSGTFAVSIELRVHAGSIDGVSTGAGKIGVGFQWY